MRDPAAFYAGSLAPDAVHLKPGYVPQDKADQHLVCCWRKGIDKGIWRGNVLAARSGFDATDFGVGYALHLLTDVRWAERLDLTFIDRYNADTDPSKPQYGTAYRLNMLACEAELYSEDPMDDVYGLLVGYHGSARGCPFDIGKWINAQLAARTDEAPECVMYVGTCEVNDFIAVSVPRLLDEWNHI